MALGSAWKWASTVKQKTHQDKFQLSHRVESALPLIHPVVPLLNQQYKRGDSPHSTTTQTDFPVVRGLLSRTPNPQTERFLGERNIIPNLEMGQLRPKVNKVIKPGKTKVSWGGGGMSGGRWGGADGEFQQQSRPLTSKCHALSTAPYTSV